LTSSFFSAVAMIALNRLQAIDPRAVIAHFSAVALAFCVVALFLFERAFPARVLWKVDVLLMLLGVGAAALIGQLFLTKAFAAGEAARVSVVGLSQVVFAMVFDALVFRDTFSAPALLGMALVVTPTAWLILSRKG